MQNQSPVLPITNPTPKPATNMGTMFLQRANEDLPTTRLLISPSYDDDKIIQDRRLLLSRAFSYSGRSKGISAQKQQRRRRASSHDSLELSDQSPSLGQNVGHPASETNLVTRLSLTLLRYLGVGYRWIIRFLALGCYAVVLMPGFVQVLTIDECLAAVIAFIPIIAWFITVGYHYFFSRKVHRSIVYGDQPRNRLDLYLPENSSGPLPVVAFVTGGAWIIGYKAWGSLLGQQLSDRDIIVACIDYRNFPQGTIGDMVKDASNGIAYICNNIHLHGGDPNRIYLMGQSAGAHIAACTLIEQAIKESGGKESVSWSVSQIKAYFGLSGGYNLFDLVDHFHSRGLYRSIFLSIMEGEESLKRYSPEVMVQDPNMRNAVALLPPVILFHGTADYSIPSDSSKNFAETLKRLGVKSESVLYEGKTHTDLFLQDPMRGGKDDLLEDLVAIIHANDQEALSKDAAAPARRRLVPEFMLKWAHNVSPF